MQFKEPLEQYVGKWISYGKETGADREFLVRLVRKDDRAFFSSISVWAQETEYNVFYPEHLSSVDPEKQFEAEVIEPKQKDKRDLMKFVFTKAPPWE
jgi:hypothetical protein